MRDFTYWNPTKIVFGRGAVDRVGELVPSDATVLITYGGGSIKRNGVYERIRTALGGAALVEFGGIEPNPRYETLMEAVALAKEKGVDFLLAVGGGSVLDGTKFIAAALHYAPIPGTSSRSTRRCSRRRPSERCSRFRARAPSRTATP